MNINQMLISHDYVLIFSKTHSHTSEVDFWATVFDTHTHFGNIIILIKLSQKRDSRKISSHGNVKVRTFYVIKIKFAKNMTWTISIGH